jgi:hypothetical protein
MPIRKIMSYLSLVTVAVRSGDKSNKDMTVAAEALSKAFISADAMTEDDKSALVAAIVNGFSKDQQSLVLVNKANIKNWTAEKKTARKNVQTKVVVYFGRLVRAAWPKVKPAEGEPGEGEGEGEGSKKGTADKADQWAKVLSNMLDQAQKLEGASFDLAGFVKALSVARSFVAIVK